MRRKFYFFLMLTSLLLIGFILLGCFTSTLQQIFNSSTYHSSTSLLVDRDFNASYLINENFLDESDDHLMWFVQLSDLHLSLFRDYSIKDDLNYFCSQTLGLIQPKVVLASGDLTDAKGSNMIHSGQYVDEWKSYQRIIHENEVLQKTVWLDIRGNHDNFGVPNQDKKYNFFKQYGIQKSKEHSYIYELRTESGDSYSFIAIDACVDPGPKRPYNFFGNLLKHDLELIEGFAKKSQSSNSTIWFGHYPTSTINSPEAIRAIMNNGVAFLCGHLHTLGGFLNKMYSRHANGLLELELGDWKYNRMFRIMAFDAGLFSFRDFHLSSNRNKNNLFILLTNPKDVQFKTLKNREPLHRMIHSTHIRFLVFSKYNIINARVYIDNVKIGLANKPVLDKPLYVQKWNPSDYKTGLHQIKIVVEDSMNNIDTVVQEFTLDNTYKSFGWLQNFVLLGDQINLTKTGFYSMTITILFILTFFRFNQKRFAVGFFKCGIIRNVISKYLRRFAFLSSVDYIFWSLVASTCYIAIGPWFIGEIIDGHFGVCFIWGIFVNGTLLSVDVQYMNGFFHMIFFQFLLMYHLAYQLETRFLSVSFQQQIDTRHQYRLNLNPGTILKLFINNFTFIMLVLLAMLHLYDLFLAYSIISIVLCPFKSWLLVMAFYLRHKCSSLPMSHFTKIIVK